MDLQEDDFFDAPPLDIANAKVSTAHAFLSRNAIIDTNTEGFREWSSMVDTCYTRYICVTQDANRKVSRGYYYAFGKDESRDAEQRMEVS